mmetsp:Transcript_46173/g.128323  ORF Transcript_46173/g.128323 Transcript_46173/m.128323 type:complete len:311 (+) Transcript_46173:496-1428(+)
MAACRRRCSHQRRLEDGTHRRARGGGPREQRLDEVAQPRRVVTPQRRQVESRARDELQQLAHANVVPAAELRLPRRRESHHLVQDAAERPDVGPAVVGLALAQLGAHVEGRAALCHRQRRARRERLGQPKVAQLDVAARREEDILRLEIAVEHLDVVVAVGEGRGELVRDTQHRRLLEPCPHTLLGRYAAREVAARGVLHADVERFAEGVRVLVCHHVRVAELLEHTHLVERRVAFFRRQAFERDLLHHRLLTLWSAHEEDGAEGALAQSLELRVARRRGWRASWRAGDQGGRHIGVQTFAAACDARVRG